MAFFEIEPNYLKLSELNYELRIRGVKSERVDIDVKRKTLRRRLREDLMRPEMTYVTPEFKFEDEKTEVDASINEIQNL